MKDQRIGCVRVSSFDQNPDRQLERVQMDKVFTDKASGKDTLRPELDALLTFVREGDTVVVHSIDRLARIVLSSALIDYPACPQRHQAGERRGDHPWLRARPDCLASISA